MRPGEIGCYLSHLAAMQAFLATDASHALILEDDATLLPALPDVLARATSRETVATLGRAQAGKPPHGFQARPAAAHAAHALCVNLFRSTGSAGYVLSRHAAEVYLDKLLPIGQPFDHAFDRGWFLGLRMREVRPAGGLRADGARTGQSTIRPKPRSQADRPGQAAEPDLPHHDGDHARRIRHCRVDRRRVLAVTR